MSMHHHATTVATVPALSLTSSTALKKRRSLRFLQRDAVFNQQFFGEKSGPCQPVTDVDALRVNSM